MVGRSWSDDAPSRQSAVFPEVDPHVQVPHCGYCQHGIVFETADLLATTKCPTEAQIRTALNGHLCRCGTYPRILTAIQRAAAQMAKAGV
jgi:aerobic-type carbon monoxide dehydrogenase small subunit (CoxS/CutS family)